MVRHVREEFDRDRDFVVTREVQASGHQFFPGQPFDKSLVTERRLRLLYEQNRITFAEIQEVLFSDDPQLSPKRVTIKKHRSRVRIKEAA